MNIYKKDVVEISLWVVFVMFLFAVSYVAEGGQSLLILLFVIAFGVLATVGITQSLSEFLEEYYCNKRDTRK